jgi:hypothetical protein
MTKKQFIQKSTPPSKKDIEEYELLSPMLEALMFEVKALSQKKQDGVLNMLKVKMINKILTRIKNLLKNDPSSEFIDLLDEAALPTNSDALFIIVQFKSAMEQFKNKYHGDRNSDFSWETRD